MTDALWQRTWPIVVAILGIAAAALVVATCNLGPLPVSVPAAGMTFGVVVSGFVATQRNMLLTMSGAEVLQFAVRTGYHRDVIRYLMDAVGAGLLVTTISLCGLFLGENSLLWGIWLSILAGAIVLVICLITRNEGLVTRMVRLYLEESNKSSRQHASNE